MRGHLKEGGGSAKKEEELPARKPQDFSASTRTASYTQPAAAYVVSKYSFSKYTLIDLDQKLGGRCRAELSLKSTSTLDKSELYQTFC